MSTYLVLRVIRESGQTCLKYILDAHLAAYLNQLLYPVVISANHDGGALALSKRFCKNLHSVAVIAHTQRWGEGFISVTSGPYPGGNAGTQPSCVSRSFMFRIHPFLLLRNPRHYKTLKDVGPRSVNSYYFFTSAPALPMANPELPRPSASLVVVNERNEILLVHRNPRARFFGGVHVRCACCGGICR